MDTNQLIHQLGMNHLSSNIVTYTYTKNYTKDKTVCGIRYDQERKIGQLEVLVDALRKHEK